MKTAYELAMERLNQASPTIALSKEQKLELAELEKRYSAKIAEREIVLRDEVNRLREAGDFAAAAEAEQRLQDDRRSLQEELERRREAVRNPAT